MQSLHLVEASEFSEQDTPADRTHKVRKGHLGKSTLKYVQYIKQQVFHKSEKHWVVFRTVHKGLGMIFHDISTMVNCLTENLANLLRQNQNGYFIHPLHKNTEKYIKNVSHFQFQDIIDYHGRKEFNGSQRCPIPFFVPKFFQISHLVFFYYGSG